MSYFAVTIETIKNIEPIIGADRIVKATLDAIDFSFVVQKGQFEIGDNCVYIPVDSILPLDVQEKLNLVGKLSGAQKNRVKTIKLKNTISMGIAAKLDLIAPLLKINPKPTPEQITEFLKITKYDHEEQSTNSNGPSNIEVQPNSKFKKFTMKLMCKLFGSTKGRDLFRNIFGYQPGTLIPLSKIGLPKYDLESCARYKSVVEYMMDKPVYISLKTEGQNSSVMCKANKKLFGIFGKSEKILVNQRNFSIIKEPNNTLWKITAKQQIDDFATYLFRKYKQTAVVYFEACGSDNGSGAISGNIYKLKEHCGFIFDIKIGDRFLDAPIVIEEINSFYGHEDYLVPQLCKGQTLKEWLNGKTVEQAAELKDVLNHHGDKLEEGIVLRLAKEEYSPELQGRLILKFRSKAYLAAHDT